MCVCVGAGGCRSTGRIRDLDEDGRVRGVKGGGWMRTDWVRQGRTTTSTLYTSRSRWCRRSSSTRAAAAAAGGGQVRQAGEIWGDGAWQELQSGDVGRDKTRRVAPGSRPAGKLPSRRQRCGSAAMWCNKRKANVDFFFLLIFWLFHRILGFIFTY